VSRRFPSAPTALERGSQLSRRIAARREDRRSVGVRVCQARRPRIRRRTRRFKWRRTLNPRPGSPPALVAYKVVPPCSGLRPTPSAAAARELAAAQPLLRNSSAPRILSAPSSSTATRRPPASHSRRSWSPALPAAAAGATSRRRAPLNRPPLAPSNPQTGPLGPLDRPLALPGRNPAAHRRNFAGLPPAAPPGTRLQGAKSF
jgi:hypothetical protein